MRFTDAAIQRLQVKRQLAQVLRLELFHLQLESDQGVQAAMKEEQVEEEVPAAAPPYRPDLPGRRAGRFALFLAGILHRRQPGAANCGTTPARSEGGGTGRDAGPDCASRP